MNLKALCIAATICTFQITHSIAQEDPAFDKPWLDKDGMLISDRATCEIYAFRYDNGFYRYLNVFWPGLDFVSSTLQQANSSDFVVSNINRRNPTPGLPDSHLPSFRGSQTAEQCVFNPRLQLPAAQSRTSLTLPGTGCYCLKYQPLTALANSEYVETTLDALRTRLEASLSSQLELLSIEVSTLKAALASSTLVPSEDKAKIEARIEALEAQIQESGRQQQEGADDIP